jgi:hypothetical protein
MKKTRLKSVSEKLMENELKELYEELYGHHVEIGDQRPRFVSCAKCGATVMFDRLDVTPSLIHLEWHKALEKEQ